jgi:hypothetical protein
VIDRGDDDANLDEMPFPDSTEVILEL